MMSAASWAGDQGVLPIAELVKALSLIEDRHIELPEPFGVGDEVHRSDEAVADSDGSGGEQLAVPGGDPARVSVDQGALDRQLELRERASTVRDGLGALDLEHLARS